MVLILGLTALTQILADENSPQVKLDAEDKGPEFLKPVARRLFEIRQLAKKKQWSKAIDEYQSLLASEADKLAAVSPEHWVSVRRLCHLDIAGFPPDAMKLYRSRVDAQAKKWYEGGAKAHDEALLRRVVDESFCSRYASSALDLLGDLAFEKGKFKEAELWWRMLARPASVITPNSLDLVFPGPLENEAQIRAKQLVAILFAGEEARFAEELKAFRKVHEKAEGFLAGRKGLFVATLEKLFQDHPGKLVRPALEGWPTFGGSASRKGATGTLPDDRNWFSRMCHDGEVRVYDLASHALLEGEAVNLERNGKNPASVAMMARSLSSHPVVVGRHVLTADSRGVTLYDPAQGTSQSWILEAPVLDDLQIDPRLPAPPDLRNTLTVADNRVYARLGVQHLDPSLKGKNADSFLVCLDIESGSKSGLHLCWQKKASAAQDKERWVFEGSPVVSDGLAYVALAMLSPTPGKSALACFDAETGTEHWRREIDEAEGAPAGMPRYQHHLVTVANSRVFYCTHAGVVVGLDAWTGRPLWKVHYPSQGLSSSNSDSGARDLSPCVHAQGRLYVAPLDSDRLLCLDASTGQILWKIDRINVIHLLGVASGRVLFTTSEGLRGVDAAHGPGSGSKNWSLPDSDTLRSYGRGLVAGNSIFWPVWVRDTNPSRLLVVDAETGEQADLQIPTSLQGYALGNLALGDRLFAVAGRRTLTLFMAPSLAKEKRRQEAKEKPQSGPALMRLGLSEADGGDLPDAIAHLEQALAMTKNASSIFGRAAHQQAVLLLHECLLEDAKRERSTKQDRKAADFLEKAAGKDFLPGLRLKALSRLATLWTDANQPARVVVVWQSILSDSELRKERLADQNGLSQPATWLASQNIDALLERHGPGLYQSFEKKAESMMPTAQAKDRLATLDRLVTEFPNLASIEKLLLDLAEALENRGNRGRAASFYRMLLARRQVTDETRSIVGYRLAGILEKLRSKQVESDSLWQRRWEINLRPNERLLSADLQEGGPLFFVEANTLTCREADGGTVLWQCDLADQPVWIGRWHECVLVGSATAITVLTIDRGEKLWVYNVPSEYGNSGTLSDFHLSEFCMYYLRGGRQVQALDPSTGRLLWQRDAPNGTYSLPFPMGRFYPCFQASKNGVVLQTANGRGWVLNSETGQTLQDLPSSRDPWSQSPISLGDGLLCLAPDTGHVILLDLKAGKVKWTCTLTGPTSLRGQPLRIVTDGRCLLLIVRRNYGDNLLRLDPSTGKQMWPEERLLGPEPIGSQQVGLGSRAVYLTRSNAISARSLADGGVLWERSLGGEPAGWSLHQAGDDLVCWPATTPSLCCRLQTPFASVECKVSYPVDRQPGISVPVLFFDAESGQLLERFNFTPGAGSAQVNLRLNPSGFCVPAVEWHRSQAVEVAPKVQIHGSKGVVQVPGKAWGIAANP